MLTWQLAFEKVISGAERGRGTKMEKKSSHPEKAIIINLKQLPPIDPFRIMNSSSNVELSKSSTRAAVKVVKPSPNQDMKLVEYDEAPRKSNSSSITETPTLMNVDDTSSNSSSIRIETRGNATSHTDSADEGMKKGSARSNLYEICAASHWKPPVFECCKQEGPTHQRKFTFKVTIEIEAASKTIIECFGAPCQKKKTAADHAAQGALWYLKHLGHVRKNQ